MNFKSLISTGQRESLGGISVLNEGVGNEVFGSVKHVMQSPSVIEAPVAFDHRCGGCIVGAETLCIENGSMCMMTLG